MSGTGATINLGGNTYNVDSEKLTNEREEFVAYLGTIAGTDSKITVNSVEYGVDSSKMTVAVYELETALSNLSGNDEPINPPVVMKAAGLYETGTDTMTVSWDDLVADGTIHVNNGVVYTNFDKNTFINNSADALVGDLILPDDGSITSLGSAVLNNSAGTLSGQPAFIGCANLTNVVIPDSVASITDLAFEGCSSLSSIIIPDNVTRIGSSAFYGCSLIESIIIPDNVVTIGHNAFESCSNLESITIGSGVTEIGDSAFYGCDGLTRMNYTGTIDQWAQIMFDVGYSNPLLYTSNLYINNQLVTEVNLTTATKIGTFAFCHCNLTSIEIPDSVTSIGAWAFSDCSSLTSVEIGDNVTEIDNAAFSNCSGLTEVVIPNGVTSINTQLFENCTSLTSIEIPNSVTSIGSSAFLGCEDLTNIYITDLTSWCNIVGLSYLMGYGSSSKKLYINDELVTEIVIPNSVTSISKRAFRECATVTSIVIPDSVTTIGEEAFYKCSSLTSVVIPDSITEIGSSAFYGCKIENATMPSLALSEISKDNLKTVVITSGSDIGTFYKHSSLISITIPNSVTFITGTAFTFCSNLTTINFNGTIAEWKAITKYDGWNGSTGDYTVVCTDGKLNKYDNVIA